MDGMLSTHNLSREDIRMRTTEHADSYLIEAHGQDPAAAVGFIQYHIQKGMLELCNFGAQLSPKALEMGVSSKRNSRNLAGTHGEGLKVAALVLVRKRHQVQIEASKFYWKFVLGGRERAMLYRTLSPMAATQVTRLVMADSRRAAAGEPRKMRGNIWEDVTVKIGNVYSQGGRRVTYEEFKEMIKVALPLNQPANPHQHPIWRPDLG